MVSKIEEQKYLKELFKSHDIGLKKCYKFNNKCFVYKLIFEQFSHTLHHVGFFSNFNDGDIIDNLTLIVLKP